MRSRSLILVAMGEREVLLCALDNWAGGIVRCLMYQRGQDDEPGERHSRRKMEWDAAR
jgi:hypothetical protein